MKLNTEKMRAIAYRKGITQLKIAEVCNLSPPTVNTVFNGRSTTEATALKIANALGVKLEEIKARG